MNCIDSLNFEVLSSKEKKSITGGLPWWIPILVETIAECIIDPAGAKEDFQTGYDRMNDWLN